MTTLKVVRATDITTDAYRESIDIYQRHIDGEDTGLVETFDIGNGMRAVHDLSRDKAVEILIRELRRYADYLEGNI